jgi:hypothetical protein
MDERETEPGMGVVPLPVAVVEQKPVPTLTGTFLGISARRAYRLNIQTNEVLVQERAARSWRGGARCCSSSR